MGVLVGGRLGYCIFYDRSLLWDPPLIGIIQMGDDEKQGPAEKPPQRGRQLRRARTRRAARGGRPAPFDPRGQLADGRSARDGLQPVHQMADPIRPEARTRNPPD